MCVGFFFETQKKLTISVPFSTPPPPLFFSLTFHSHHIHLLYPSHTHAQFAFYTEDILACIHTDYIILMFKLDLIQKSLSKPNTLNTCLSVQSFHTFPHTHAKQRESPPTNTQHIQLSLRFSPDGAVPSGITPLFQNGGNLRHNFCG